MKSANPSPILRNCGLGVARSPKDVQSHHSQRASDPTWTFTPDRQWQRAWGNKVLPGRGRISSVWTPARWASPELISFASFTLLKTLQVEQDTMICCPVPGEQTIQSKRGERKLWNGQHLHRQSHQNKSGRLAPGYMKQIKEWCRRRQRERWRNGKNEKSQASWRGARMKAKSFPVRRGYGIYAMLKKISGIKLFSRWSSPQARLLGKDLHHLWALQDCGLHSLCADLHTQGEGNQLQKTLKKDGWKHFSWFGSTP